MMKFSRREFIMGLAMAVSPRIAMAAMQTLGLSDVPGSARPHDRIRSAPADLGKGKSVVVVGAGLAGLVAAYEFMRLGFDVTVLEAHESVGGRMKTLRSGDTVRYDDGTVQSVDFDEDLYFDAGAARIPSTHTGVLGYCRELGVPMEVISILSQSALCVVNDGGVDRRYTVGQLQGDARGYISEMLARCAKQGHLDGDLNASDQEKLIGLLRTFGDLSESGVFSGTRRSGYTVSPGSGSVMGVRRKKLDFRIFLDRRTWYPLWYDEHLEYQPTMLRPVGGMDNLAKALARKLGSRIILNARVSEINVLDGKAQVIYSPAAGSMQKACLADYSVVTCPLPIVTRLKSNLPKAFFAAAAAVPYRPAYKIGWQTPRFWEQDSNIYGGISFLDDDTSLVWYPSNGIFSSQGILVGGYAFGRPAMRYAALSLKQQHAASRHSVERLHPGQGKNLTRPVTVAWHKLPYSLGGWASLDRLSFQDYETIVSPHECFYFAGEHASHMPGWLEGSARSAIRAVELVVERISTT